MKKITLAFLLFCTVCAFSQSPVSLRMGKEVDNKSFVKFGNKKILEYDENTIFFTTGNSIGKLTGNHLEAKYAAGRQNSGKFPILHTTTTDHTIVQISFDNWKLAKISFPKTNLIPVVKGGQILKNYTGIVKRGSEFEYKVGKSKNKEFTAISLMIFDNKQNISLIDVFLFDKDMNLIREHSINHSFETSSISMGNVSVSNTGDILVCFGGGNQEKRERNFSEQVEIAFLTQNEEEYISIPLDGNHLMDYTADFDKKGNIYVAGYLCTADYKTTTATFSFLIDGATQIPGDISIQNFPDNYEAVHPFYMPELGMGVSAFPYSTKAHEIIFVDDHNAYLIGYEYARKMFGANVNAMILYQFSRNVIFTKINSEAQAEAVEFIEMSSHALYSWWKIEPKTFCVAADEGKLYLIYVDNAKNLQESNRTHLKDLQLFNHVSFYSNKEACVLAIISPDETITKKIIYDNSSQKTGILLAESLSFDPERRCFKGFMAEKRAPGNTPSSIGLRTVEIPLP